MTRRLTSLLISTLTCLCACAVNPAQVRWHDEASDTLRINELLTRAVSECPSAQPAAIAAWLAPAFIGTPYVASTLEAPGPEMLVVNLDGLDCTTFVETVAALAITAAEKRTSWRDYIATLESLRYRHGQLGTYASRLHYISDWAVDNIARRNLTDATDRFPTVDYKIGSLDFMTSHRAAYPALADDAEYARMKSVEEAYRNHKFPFVKSSRFQTDKRTLDTLRPGDIVCFTTAIPGLDVSHLGLVVAGDDGAPRLLHASSASGKVEISSLTFPEYFKKNRKVTGARILRLAPR